MDKEMKNIISGRQHSFYVSNIPLGEFILKGILKGGDNIAVVNASTNQSVTFIEIAREILRTIKTFRDYGLKKGDVITVCSENLVDYAVPIIAALCLGAITAPMNQGYTEGEMDHCMKTSEPKIIICSAQLTSRVAQLKRRFDHIKHVLVFGTDINSKRPAKMSTQEDLQREILNLRLNPINTKEDTAFIFSSSGTTGLPKGVMLTHYNISFIREMLTDMEFGCLHEGTCQVNFLPFFHAYGSLLHLLSLSEHIKQVILERYNEELFLRMIEKHRCTTAFLVPPVCVTLAKSEVMHSYDLSSMKEVLCGAAPLSENLSDAVCKRLNLYTIRQGFGLTEVTLGMIFIPKNYRKSGSVGKVIPGIHTKVADLTTGEALGPNQKGEICFKGGALMKGYYRNPEATAAAFDKDGWLCSGDIGYYDEEHDFFIVDRLKELIKYNGFQVAPAELEGLLLQHDAVKDVGVIGVPDERVGERALAFIVRQPGSSITADEIIQYVSKRVSQPKQLHGGVQFLDEIPKSPSGKILRRVLRQMVKVQSHL